jgi:hypothetical protein
MALAHAMIGNLGGCMIMAMKDVLEAFGYQQ